MQGRFLWAWPGRTHGIPPLVFPTVEHTHVVAPDCRESGKCCSTGHPGGKGASRLTFKEASDRQAVRRVQEDNTCRVLGADPALGLSAPHTAATWVFIYGCVTTTIYQLWSKIAPASWSWDKVSPSLINKYQAYMDFPVAQMVKNLPAMQETWVRSLG